MDPRLINHFSLVLFAQYAVIAVDDFNIFITEVPFVPVDEQKIPSGDTVIFNPVAGQDIDLHAVIADEQMTAAAYDRMGGIVKQVVYIENVVIVGGKIVVKIIFPHIDRCFDVNPVVAEIDESHPFRKRERGGAVFDVFIFERGGEIGIQGAAGVVKNAVRFGVCARGGRFGRETSQADMFVLEGDRTAVIGSPVLFCGGIHTFFHFVPPSFLYVVCVWTFARALFEV